MYPWRSLRTCHKGITKWEVCGSLFTMALVVGAFCFPGGAPTIQEAPSEVQPAAQIPIAVTSPVISKENPTIELNDKLSLGQPCVVENVTVWPVFGKGTVAPMDDFTTLEKAQEQHKAEVREEGTVSRLLI